jgi:glucose dehydrogenase
MRRSRVLVAVLLLVVGLAWIGQGSGMVAGSAMSGSSFWAVAGVAVLIAGLVIGTRELIRRPISRP